MTIYDDYIKDINKILKNYFEILVKIKENFNALEVNLMDGFEENV